MLNTVTSLENRIENLEWMIQIQNEKIVQLEQKIKKRKNKN